MCPQKRKYLKKDHTTPPFREYYSLREGPEWIELHFLCLGMDESQLGKAVDILDDVKPMLARLYEYTPSGRASANVPRWTCECRIFG